MRFTRRNVLLDVSSTILIALSIFLSGCAGGILTPPAGNAEAITGNWQLSSNAAAASKLPTLSGSLVGSAAAITGVFHSNSASACISPSTVINLTGSADHTGLVKISGAIDGGTLTITGTLAGDGKSLSDASYNVTGGSCAFSAPATATAQSYNSVTGNYIGTLSDATGPVISITAALTQSPESDTNGNFQVSGTGTFPSNSCFSSPASVSNSQVTGGSFSITYTDPAKGNTVAVSGNFSPDANTLTITNWTLTGGTCGSDSGTGSFTRTQ